MTSGVAVHPSVRHALCPHQKQRGHHEAYKGFDSHTHTQPLYHDQAKIWMLIVETDPTANKDEDLGHCVEFTEAYTTGTAAWRLQKDQRAQLAKRVLSNHT